MDKNEKAKTSDLANSYRFEVDFCDGLLPKPLTEAETIQIVKDKIAELGDAKVGTVIGAIMKDNHVGIAASIVKRVATQILGESK